MTKAKKTAQTANLEKKETKKVLDQSERATHIKNQQLETQLKRALADYQNLERRIEEERKLLGQLSSMLIIEKFLPVLDNLENAQAHLNDQGLEMVIKQFKDVLLNEGVGEIDAARSQFNPNFHEAVEVTEGPDEGRIVKVIRKGYKINDKVLRPAQVIVERKAVNQSNEEKVEEVTPFSH